MGYGHVQIACVSLYPIEKWFFRNKINNDVIADLIANFATGIGDKRIDYIQDIDNYYADLEKQYNFYQQLDNTTITLEVSSTGDGNVTHDFSVIASNPALGTAAGLVSVDAASLFANVTSGSPAQLQNDLNPAVAGDILGLFTGGGNVLLLDSDPSSVPGNLNNGVEIPTVTTPVTPTSSPAIGFNYETFSLVLTIQASGTPLIVDDAGCIFDEPGGPAVLPVE